MAACVPCPLCASSPETCYLGLDPSVRKSLQGMPFFLMGQSMGGALALLAALRLRSDKTMSDVAQHLVGVMTNCPAIIGVCVWAGAWCPVGLKSSLRQGLL